ncbi:hypothetical protein GF351_00365, partial [Candidatus Woesearchaeota archaeon]|nr:hypothetical protein [Candidatus Woesearchaeota archaeon]
MRKSYIIVAVVLLILVLAPTVSAISFTDLLKKAFKASITGYIAGEQVEDPEASRNIDKCDPSHKVRICHVPPGNPENSRMLCVDKNGWNGHAQHPDDFIITDQDDDGDIDDEDCVIAVLGDDPDDDENPDEYDEDDEDDDEDGQGTPMPSLSLDPDDAADCLVSGSVIITNTGDEEKDDASNVQIIIYPVKNGQFVEDIIYDPEIGDIQNLGSVGAAFTIVLAPAWSSQELGAEVKIRIEVINEDNRPDHNIGRHAHYTLYKSAEPRCDYGSICAEEVCDGLDNDCDGLIDEDITRQCGETDVGACEFGVEICAMGRWQDCEGAVYPDIETCNSLDDDCDGQVDESLVQECGTNTGQCTTGTQTCVDGNWSGCSGTYTSPSEEICDAVDNDCDGQVDEELDCACTNGQTRPCGTDTGVCKAGTQKCSLGVWGECSDAVMPMNETCNGLDDDCDGFIDEDLEQQCGDYFIGACSYGTQTCSEGRWTACSGEVGPAQETCNGLDDDCDGKADESLTKQCGKTAAGICELGVMTCADASWSECEGAIYPELESCDGLDNDCDGLVDENLSLVCGSDVGLCEQGIRHCINSSWNECLGSVTPDQEVCDGLDNDCDGFVDEELTMTCGTDIGECTPGIKTCIDGVWGSCEGTVSPENESCD